MIHYVASIYKNLGHMTHGYANNVSIKYKYEDTNDKSPIHEYESLSEFVLNLIAKNLTYNEQKGPS